MASIYIAESSIPLTSTGSAAGFVTVSQPKRFPKGAIVYLSLVDGTLGIRCRVVRSNVGGVIWLKLAPENTRENFHLADYSAYVAGSILTCPGQEVPEDRVTGGIEDLTGQLTASGTATTVAATVVLNSNDVAIINQGATNDLLVSFDNGATYNVTIKAGQAFSTQEVVGTIYIKSGASTTTYNIVYDN